MRSIVLVLHTFFHLTAMTSASPVRPSFDCAKVEQADERAICSDEDLAQRDQLDTQAFAELTRRPEAADAGITENRKFLAARRACGADTECIRRQQDAVLVAFARIAYSVSSSAETQIKPIVIPEPTQTAVFAGVIGALLLLGVTATLARRKIAELWQGARKKASDNKAIRNIRREERRPTRFRRGKLYDDRGRFLTDCTICDRSKNGAKVRFERKLASLQAVRFLDEVENISVEAKVAWQRGNEIGLAFRSVAAPVELPTFQANFHGKSDKTAAAETMRDRAGASPAKSSVKAR